MSKCDSCASKHKCSSNASTCEVEINTNHKINKIIGIMSGKGGVGKSTVTVLIAKKLSKMGYKVGVLDADITGPSIPRLMKTQDERAVSPNGKDIIPIVTKDGIKTMSINYMVGDEDQPVVFKGPMIEATVKQFYKDVMWEELDYLLIDMPPGTGDVALTVMKSIPIDGIIMVSIPQDMISMIVSKAVNMAKKLNVNVIGLVENMSYIKCPDCEKKIKIFDGEQTEQFLNTMDLELLGELPMTKEIINITHNGIDEISSWLDEILTNIVKKIPN